MPFAATAHPAELAPDPGRGVVIAFSPWMENLLWQYRTGVLASPQRRLRRYLMMMIVAMLAAAGIALSPRLLLTRIRAAYPSEPGRQRALELCARVDPTFVRFLASERAACYARFPDLVALTSADSR